MPNARSAAAAEGLPQNQKPAPIPFLDPDTLPGEYALMVSGGLMAPALRNGDAAFFTKAEHYGRGNLVGIFLQPHAVRPGALNVEVYRLKHDAMRGVTYPFTLDPKSEVEPVIVVETISPRRQKIIRCQDILAIHRCLGAMHPDCVDRSDLSEAGR